ncbi:MAG: cellulase family glycosylhydrolase [Alistipes sp.]|nr:cellulase family glycosylhydrolase [Alistipes sp.]
MFAIVAVALTIGCSTPPQDSGAGGFVGVERGQFIRGGKPYYFIGTNFWYGPILASQGEGGNRERLAAELDDMQAAGIDNLRVLVGADGLCGVPSKVEPTLQVAPGEYDDALLDGLDYFMAELGRRGMTAVLYLNNSWEWSGGYSQYLAWARGDKAPVPSVDGWPAYMAYVEEFMRSDEAQRLFENHVRFIISRTNRYTGAKYVDDPAIFSWQIGNEPRAFSDDNKEAFAEWIASTARLIRELDPNHMISTGSEGKHGCEQDAALCERIHSTPEISYINCHVWPYNWGWISAEDMAGRLEEAKALTKAYIVKHEAMGERLGKPVVVEEFGFPRDGMGFDLSTSVDCRDSYYKYVFSLVGQAASEGGVLAGCNFWGWGGRAVPPSDHIFWQRGDDYMCDPAQEEQGLNSVFSADESTIAVIAESNSRLNAINR